MENDLNEQQAIDFLQKTNTTLTFEFSHVENQRFVYKWILKKVNREAKGKFTESQEGKFNERLKHTVKFANAKLGKPIPSPSAYDLLTCLTKDDVGTVDRFAEEFGYEKPSEAIRVHALCKNEYQQLCSLFNEQEMDELREIQ